MRRERNRRTLRAKREQRRTDRRIRRELLDQTVISVLRPTGFGKRGY